MFIWVTWAGEPLRVFTLTRRAGFWLGDRPGDLPIPLETGARWRLVRFDGKEPRVLIPGRAPLSLGVGRTVTTRVGVFSVSISHAVADTNFRKRSRLGATLSGLSVALFIALGVLAYAHALFAAWRRTADLAGGTAETLPLFALDEQDDAKRRARPTPATVSAATRYSLSISGQERCGDALMGEPEVISESAHYGIEGKPDEPDPHLSRERGGAWLRTLETETSAPSVVARSLLPNPNAPTARWGRRDASASYPTSRPGKLFADRLDAARGDDGLGLARADGGIEKRIAWAPLIEAEGSARVVHSGLRVSGALRPSTIGRVMAAHFASVRSCYSRRLARAPALGGRLELAIDIGKEGLVRSLRVASATFHDPELDACVLSALRDLAFPRAEAGATAVVYPLWLIRAGDRPDPGSRRPQPKIEPVCGACR